MNQYISVGLDVHADSITAAILDGDAQDPEVVKLPGDLMKVRRLFRRLAKKKLFEPVTRLPVPAPSSIEYSATTDSSATSSRPRSFPVSRGIGVKPTVSTR
jgi:hypothetical protein